MPTLATITPPAPIPARRPFERMSFSRQFLLASSILLLAGMFIVGAWLSMEIERSSVNRTASIAALYVESILVAQLHPTPAGVTMLAGTHEAFDHIFLNGPLQRKVVRFKLWGMDGTILYSSDHAQLGQRFPVEGELAAAFAGEMQAHVSRLDEAGHEAERERWSRLLEVYVPVRAEGGNEVVAVAEFYYLTDTLMREIRQAQQRSWILVGVATLAIFLLLFVQVRRANDMIVQQRDDLSRQLQLLRVAFEENERMRTRLGEAGAATTALNEELLHRIAADLHDGPAQTLAYALMRLEEQVDATGGAHSERKIIHAALKSSLDELRNIAAGLGVPGIADLTLTETAHRAVRDFERQTTLKVNTAIEDDLLTTSLATKITVYRLLQESLANSYRHARGGTPQVRVGHDAGQVVVEISDQGAGFDAETAAQSGRLGLAFMKERVRLLGGNYLLETAPGRGTRILARLPLGAKDT